MSFRNHICEPPLLDTSLYQETFGEKAAQYHCSNIAPAIVTVDSFRENPPSRTGQTFGNFDIDTRCSNNHGDIVLDKHFETSATPFALHRPFVLRGHLQHSALAYVTDDD
jgi:hypothetical protein